MPLICQVVWVEHEGIGRPERNCPENLIQKTNKCNESQPTRMVLGRVESHCEMVKVESLSDTQCSTVGADIKTDFNFGNSLNFTAVLTP